MNSSSTLKSLHTLILLKTFNHFIFPPPQTFKDFKSFPLFYDLSKVMIFIESKRLYYFVFSTLRDDTLRRKKTCLGSFCSMEQSILPSTKISDHLRFVNLPNFQIIRLISLKTLNHLIFPPPKLSKILSLFRNTTFQSS